MSNNKTDLTYWNPKDELTAATAVAVEFSRGYLRCKPEKWFPGISSRWTSFANSMGVNLKVLNIEPKLADSDKFDKLYLVKIDEEYIQIGFDRKTFNNIIEVVVPGSKALAGRIAAEYMIRRFVSSIASFWAGPAIVDVLFDSEILDSDEYQKLGCVEISLMLNDSPCTIKILLPEKYVSLLDGLWRRQLASDSRKFPRKEKISLEIAEDFVAKEQVKDYLLSKGTITLKANKSDKIKILCDNKPWMDAQLMAVENKFAFQTLSENTRTVTLPQDKVKVSIQLGSMTLESETLLELMQPQAILATDIALDNMVELVVANQVVGSGKIGILDGKFALKLE